MKNEARKESGLGTHPEARLFEQAQGGSQESLELLLERHEPLVKYAVQRQNLGDLPYEEALQGGRIGLWQAIRGFDPHKGYQFSTYAYGAIVHQVWKDVKAHCEANGQAHAYKAWGMYFRAWEVGAVQRERDQELSACLKALVARLPERLRRVIVGRYGLEGQEPQSLPLLGAELGVCGERVRQLQVEALVWLRHPAHSQELRELLQRHSLQEYEWAEEVTQAWLRRRGGRHGQA